jgi:hypothetical protein
MMAAIRGTVYITIKFKYTVPRINKGFSIKGNRIESFMPLIPAERQFYLLVVKRQVVRGGMKNTYLWLKEFMRSI